MQMFFRLSPAATGLGFVCVFVFNPCVLSANRVDLGFFCFINFPILLLSLQPHPRGRCRRSLPFRRMMILPTPLRLDCFFLLFLGFECEEAGFVLIVSLIYFFLCLEDYHMLFLI